MEPNAYAYSIGGGVAYACPACYFDAVTEGRDPEDVPDFNPVTLEKPKRATCDFKQWETPRGCRKRAKVFVLARTFFGMRVGPNGNTPTYTQSVLARCPVHADERIINIQFSPGAFLEAKPIPTPEVCEGCGTPLPEKED